MVQQIWLIGQRKQEWKLSENKDDVNVKLLLTCPVYHKAYIMEELMNDKKRRYKKKEASKGKDGGRQGKSS